MRYGCRRGEAFEGYERTVGEPACIRRVSRDANEVVRGNTVNPRSGTGLQHARDPQAEEAVEVVRHHEDGTRVVVGCHDSEGARASARAPGVDARGKPEEGTLEDESQERTKR